MRFTQTHLVGAYVIDVEPITDDRGFFARTFCANELADRGLRPLVAQGNMSYNPTGGTLRGFHYQRPPAAESKLVRCTRGAIVDVVVDLRPDSATYLQHVAVELTADNRRSLYVPPLFAHAYQTLVDDTEVSYLVSEFYAPGVEDGLRYDDPALGIAWPLAVEAISDKDRSWPLLESP